MSRIRPKLMSCHWSFGLPYRESKSQASQSSSDHVGLLRTLSTIDTQGSKHRVRLVLEVLAKLMVEENSSWEFPKVVVHLILEVRLILETRSYMPEKIIRKA